MMRSQSSEGWKVKSKPARVLMIESRATARRSFDAPAFAQRELLGEASPSGSAMGSMLAAGRVSSRRASCEAYVRDKRRSKRGSDLAWSRQHLDAASAPPAPHGN